MPNEIARTAVWEGTFTLFGVEIRCYVLDDGTRFVNADDVERLFTTIDDRNAYDPVEMVRFNQWRLGKDV